MNLYARALLRKDRISKEILQRSDKANGSEDVSVHADPLSPIMNI